MDGMIRAHCMGTVFPTFEEQASYRKLIEDAALLWRDMAKTEFPKRDTDSPQVTWAKIAELIDRDTLPPGEWRLMPALPSAADLDAAAEEQRVKEKTGG